MKNIVLITSTNPVDPYNRLSVNLGTLALEAYLSKHSDINVFLIENLQELEEYKPELVGISSVTENYGRAIEMAREIKERLSIPVIIGGIHISTCPESLHPVFDAGVIGEGEETLLEFLSAYPHIDKIPGIAYWKSGSIHLTEKRLPLKNLDLLPHPNRKKWVANHGWPVLMTSRGCAYRCKFCASPVMWGGYRDFSPEYVMEEIREMITAFRVKHIRFFDDTFTMNRKRLKKLVEMIQSEGINNEVSFSCFSRSNHLDGEMMGLLQRGNIKLVIMGVESASDEVLPTLKDRGVGARRNQQIIDMACDNGLKISCTVIIGSPEETEQDLLKTYSFLSKNIEKLYEVEINPLVPLPGTEIWEYAKKKGLVSNTMDWSLLKDYSNLLLFDADRYIYLNEHVPYEKFLTYVKGFRGLFRQALKSDRELFGDIVPIASLKKFPSIPPA